ncbi:MAG TPA: glycosyltransferase [Pyrinomonadaceae bacterium]|jgi:glycosyltransferase involved in cell wall biosynthesis
MTPSAPIRTLYLCYFGLREPLVQTQVLPYLRQLAAAGIEVYLLTFEPELQRAWPARPQAEMRAQLAAQGIRWFARAYHKRPSAPATLYDVLVGAWTAQRLVRRYRIDVVHARSHVPLMMALMTQKLTGCRVVFDVRGLMAEEYVDAGLWAEGSLPYRAVKWVERAGLRRADQLVVLTRRMRAWVVAEGYAAAEKIEVIPCCVDFGRFAAASTDPGAAPTDAARFELIYVGAVTGLYLLEEIGRFYLAVRAARPDAYLRILTKGSVTEAAAVLERTGLSAADFWIGAAQPADVPQYLRRARLGLSFRKATFAQIAASPTKIPEYLAAGLPVVSNAGIGDTDELLTRERVGVVLKSFDAPALAEAATQALALASEPDVQARCVRVARAQFDLVQVGGSGYTAVYRRLQAHAAPARASAPEPT